MSIKNKDYNLYCHNYDFPPPPQIKDTRMFPYFMYFRSLNGYRDGSGVKKRYVQENLVYLGGRGLCRN